MTKIYDWAAWFAKRRLVLRPGKDFDCSTLAFAQQIRNAATRHGVKVGIEEKSGGAIRVTVTRKGEPCPQ